MTSLGLDKYQISNINIKYQYDNWEVRVGTNQNWRGRQGTYELPLKASKETSHGPERSASTEKF